LRAHRANKAQSYRHRDNRATEHEQSTEHRAIEQRAAKLLANRIKQTHKALANRANEQRQYC
jgi:hypothetical protein